MNFKDKLAICLVLLAVVILGITLKSKAEINIDGTVINCEYELAQYASNNRDKFVDTEITANWFANPLHVHYPGSSCCGGTGSTIGKFKTALCVVHDGDDLKGNSWIANIIDIKWNSETNEYVIINRFGTDANGDEISDTVYPHPIDYTDNFKYLAKGTYYATEHDALKQSGDYALAMARIFENEFLKNGNVHSISPEFGSVFDNKGSTSSTYYKELVDYNPIKRLTTGSQLSKTKEGNYTILGPFKIDGDITNVTIKNKISEQDIREVSSYGGAIEYSYGGSWHNAKDGISLKEEFYIRFEDIYGTYDGGDLTVSFNGEDVYEARIVLTKSSDTQNKFIYNAKNLGASTVIYSLNTNTSLIVEKKGENEEIQPNVNFRLSNASSYATWSNKEEVDGTIVYSNITFNNWEDTQNQIFTTGATGKFIIQGLSETEAYSLQETGNPNYLYTKVNIKQAYLDNGKASLSLGATDSYKQEMGEGFFNFIYGIQLSNSQENILKIVDKKETLEDEFYIGIKKVNKTNQPLKGAEFKVKVFTKENKFLGWLRQNGSDGYEYDTSYNDATVWSTDSGNNGQFYIEDLDLNYQYEVYETKAATGYSLSNQTQGKGLTVEVNGYKYENQYIGYGTFDLGHNLGSAKLVFCGRVSHSFYKNGANIKVENVKGDPPHNNPEYVDISGIVWEDRMNKSEYNNVYDDGDNLLNGVTVRLISIINGIQVGSDQVTSNGRYKFSKEQYKITKENLSNYYIQILYDGIGSTYRIVEYGTGINSSRAEFQSPGSAATFSIDNVDSSNQSYMYIGLRAIPTNTQSVEKWVKNVQVKMNIKGQSYSYRYDYGKDNSSVGGVGNVGIGNKSYYRTIYASDIAYHKSAGVTNGLEVYITYTIRVNNNTSTYQTQSKGAKREKYMTVTVKDVYDDDHYILADNNWTGSNGTITYNSTLKVERASSKDIDVTFKLTESTLTEILTKGSFTSGNKVQISGKHTYEIFEQTNTSNKSNNGEVDSNVYFPGIGHWVPGGGSGSGSKPKPTPKYEWVEHTDENGFTEIGYAPGMTFSIYDGTGTIAERTITGTVFEDQNIKEDGQIVGDGKYDNSKEDIVKDVTVELLEHGKYKAYGKGKNESQDVSVAKRYIYNEENAYYNIKTDSTTTKENGVYTFSGIIPGDYYVRFTYGDGSQTIIKTNPGGSEEVTAYKYKSTIVSNVTLQELIKDDRDKELYYNNSNYYWYRNTSSNSWSTAVDILGDREVLNKQTSEIYDMRAYTPTFRINIENKGEANSGPNKDVTEYKIENMNFGIIDTPKIELGFEKKMTNIKVTNTQGNIIIDGNPANVGQSMKYLSNLDTSPYLIKGSDHAKIEIKDEEIYGAKVEITYGITIINNSDVNYCEDSSSSSYGHYYMFGIFNPNDEVNITIKQVNDYLDTKLTYLNSDRYVEQGTDSEGKSCLILKEDPSTGDKVATWKKLYSQRTVNETLENGDKKPREDGKVGRDTTTIIATRILSNTDSDMDFINDAIVANIEVTGNPKLVENVNKHKEDSKYTNYFKYTKNEYVFNNPSKTNELLIIPETGADMLTPIIYTVTACMAGIIITIGIIVIKKKVI